MANVLPGENLKLFDDDTNLFISVVDLVRSKREYYHNCSL